MGAEYAPVTKTEETWRYLRRQVSAAMAVIMLGFQYGLSLGAPTVIVPQLRKEANSTSAVSEDAASWITAIIPSAAIGWMLILIAATHYLGRKKPAISAVALSTCGFVVLYYSKNIMQVFYSQLIQGASYAASHTISYMILLEYTSLRHRGFFFALKSASYCWGIWVANAIGTFFHYKYIGMFGMLWSVIILFAFLTIPESPYWLATQKRYEECATGHRWLMGSGNDAEKELNALITTQMRLNEEGKTKMSIKGVINNFKTVLKQPDIYKPFCLCLVAFASFYFTGKIVCAVYAVEILSKIVGSQSTTYAAMLVVDGFTVAGIYGGAILSKLLQRRLLFIGTSIMCVVFLFTIAVYLYLIKLCVISENVYILITLMIGYTLASCIGPVGSAPTLVGELFPIQHKTLLITIFSIYTKLVSAIFLKTGPYLLKILQVQGMFMFFATGLLICLFFICKYLPETKGKSAQEISELFQSKQSVKETELQKFCTENKTT